MQLAQAFTNPILVPGGGLAIAAIGRVKQVVDVNVDESRERRMKVGIIWSADHRAVEGVELTPFVECWSAVYRGA